MIIINLISTFTHWGFISTDAAVAMVEQAIQEVNNGVDLTAGTPRSRASLIDCLISGSRHFHRPVAPADISALTFV